MQVAVRRCGVGQLQLLPHAGVRSARNPAWVHSMHRRLSGSRPWYSVLSDVDDRFLLLSHAFRFGRMSSTVAHNSIPTASPRTMLTLAVVERQLIMQGLEMRSLCRLASTCKHMRAEAMHREAGKFMHDPVRGLD